jgi:thiosulfate reductase cytochrome b subunit
MAHPKSIHPAFVRLTHWVNAAAIAVMIASGPAIHNAHPTLPFAVPPALTFGLGFIGGLRWHFAAMWVLAVNFILMIAYGLASGRYRRKFLPLAPGDVLQTLRDALRGRLAHADLSAYNGVQKLLYVGVLAAIALAILSGLSIWKPIQFQTLTLAFGDFDRARLVHFGAMAAIFLFLLVHIAMALLTPRTLAAMIGGR